MIEGIGALDEVEVPTFTGPWHDWVFGEFNGVGVPT